MKLAADFIVPVLINLTESVLFVALTWFFKKTIQSPGKLRIDKLMAWASGFIFLLIPIFALLPETFLSEIIKVYVIVGLSGLALFFLTILLRNQKKMFQNQIILLQNQVSKHPCGMDMSTEEKRFESNKRRGGISPIFRIPIGQGDPKVEITWATLIKGIQILKEDLKRASVQPNIIFGINDTGIIMAGYFSCFYNHCSIGIVRTGQVDDSGKRVITIDWPELNVNQKQPLSILLVDGEIKSGKSAMEIQKKISVHYQQNKCLENCITSIALGGVLKDGDKDTTKKETLTSNDFGWDLEKFPKYKPAFVAFYLDYPGFESPEFMR